MVKVRDLKAVKEATNKDKEAFKKGEAIPDVKTKVMTIRITEAEHALFKKAAAADRRKLIDWIRNTLTLAAEKN